MLEVKYIELKDLEVYKNAREYSKLGWEIYEGLDWQIKKVMGDQMITSIDSIGANIAEGYGRYHYLDKIKFYYNARGSLLESGHWVALFFERKKINFTIFQLMKEKRESISYKLNLLIKSQYNSKFNDKVESNI